MITPFTCPICGSNWKGGSTTPGEHLKPKMRVFYDCGVAISYRKDEGKNRYHVLISNCGGNKKENIDEFFCDLNICKCCQNNVCIAIIEDQCPKNNQSSIFERPELLKSGKYNIRPV